jgi:hypothetical protein
VLAHPSATAIDGRAANFKNVEFAELSKLGEPSRWVAGDGRHPATVTIDVDKRPPSMSPADNRRASFGAAVRQAPLRLSSG